MGPILRLPEPKVIHNLLLVDTEGLFMTKKVQKIENTQYVQVMVSCVDL